MEPENSHPEKGRAEDRVLISDLRRSAAADKLSLEQAIMNIMRTAHIGRGK